MGEGCCRGRPDHKGTDHKGTWLNMDKSLSYVCSILICKKETMTVPPSEICFEGKLEQYTVIN